MKALLSSARQEVVDVLTQLGRVSVAELARVLDRPADALYYHLRILKRVGLVEELRWTQNGRAESLFRTVADDLRIDYEAARAHSGGKDLARIVASMLRLGIRDFRTALANPEVACSGNGRELWAARKTGWLRKKDLASVVRFVEALAQSVARPSGAGRLYGVTIVLTPLSRRRVR